MRYVRSLSLCLLVCFGVFAEESKIVPIGKTITASDDQIKGLFKVIEHKNPTPVQIEKTKEFLEKNPLPPRELFTQRREAVDNFFEEVLGRDPSKSEMRKTMEFLVEQETIAKIKSERAKEISATDQRSPTAALNPLAGATLTNNGVDPLDIAAIAAQAAAQGATVPGAFSTTAATSPASTAAETAEDSSPRGRSAHSVGGPTPASESEVVSPIVSLPIALPPTPAEALSKKFPTIKEGLERALGDRVESGQITREAGDRAMKDILMNFQGREDRTAQNEEPPRPILGAPKGPSIIPGPIPKDEIGLGTNTAPVPLTSAVLGNAMSAAPFNAAAAKPPTGTPAPANGMVADEMSKVLTDFGKLSLATDEKGESRDRLQTAGAGPSSGDAPAAVSDNTGLTPAIVAKSGGTLNLAVSAEATKEKVASWLDKYVDEYLKKGNGVIDKRLLASPHPLGLPTGSLVSREQKPANFHPDTPNFLSLASAAPELPVVKSPALPVIFWLLFAAILFRTVMVLRRRPAHEEEENRREPQEFT